QGGDLALEDGVETVVVADGGEDGGVGIQGDARQRQAVALEAADQLGDEVLGIGGRSAIAAGKDLAVVGQGAEQQVDPGGQRLGEFAGAGLEGVDCIVEVRCHERCHIHDPDYLMSGIKNYSKALQAASRADYSPNAPRSQLSPSGSTLTTSKRQAGT